MAYVPPRRPTSVELNDAKRMRERTLNADRRRAGEWARQLRATMDAAARRLKPLVEDLQKSLDAIPGDVKRGVNADGQFIGQVHNFDGVASQLERQMKETHAALGYSPLTQMPEFHAPNPADGNLLQMVAMLVILLRRLLALRHGEAAARKAAAEASSSLKRVRDLANKR